MKSQRRRPATQSSGGGAFRSLQNETSNRGTSEATTPADNIANHSTFEGINRKRQTRLGSVLLVFLVVAGLFSSQTLRPTTTLSNWSISLSATHNVTDGPVPSILPSTKSKKRVVLSLTTIPERVDYLQPTLDSLLKVGEHQSADVVYLTLPKRKRDGSMNNYTSLPAFVQNYMNREKLVVLHAELDYGPITKVFYALQQEQQRGNNANDYLIYVDDDVVYRPDLVENLVQKAMEFPNEAVAYTGAVLRSGFRQIKQSTLQQNVFPNLFFQISDTPTMLQNHRIDIVQGFSAVCVQPHFFDLPALQALLERSDVPKAVVDSDDFLISAHLESQHVPRRIVSGGGGIPQVDPVTSQIHKLSTFMHRNAMDAAVWLQQEMNIWNELYFVNRTALTKQQQDAIDCEAGHKRFCFEGYQTILNQLPSK